MHSGNLGLSQNLDTFVDAAARLRSERGIEWVLMGGGARQAALAARVGELGLERVRFLPRQPEEELADAFGSADIFVIGLRQGSPAASCRASSTGSSRGPSLRRRRRARLRGRQHHLQARLRAARPPGDAAVLASRVLELYRDRELCRHLGANARRAAESFDRPGQVDAYARILREAGNEPRPVRQSRRKRAFDAALAGLGLVLSAPLWALVALAVKLATAGPSCSARIASAWVGAPSGA